MLIVSLTLIRYRRMALNSINEFTITPTEVVQLILGTNGCGKSSLIRELTPLPPDSNDYFKDGSKTISIINRGNNYTLKSTFAPTSKHSFIKNEEELNQGGTITVFRELVRQEFGITPDIHDLLTGSEVFHLMSQPRRREWLIKLSDTNYDYALEVYNSLKERSRDVSGALKLAKKRYVTESAKAVSEAEEKKLRHDADLTHKELNLLIEQSAPLDKPISEYEAEKVSALDELHSLSNKLLRMKCVAPYGTYPYGVNPSSISQLDDCGNEIKYGFSSIDEIDVLINNQSHEKTKIETLINKEVSEHNTVKDKIDILVKTGTDGIKSLHDKLIVLKNKKVEILNKRKLNIDIVDPVHTLKSFESVYDILTSVFLALPENEDKRFSQAKLNADQTRLLNAKNDKASLVLELGKLEANKVHLETHKANGNIACPKCHHVWIVGYSDEQFAILLTKIKNKEDEIVALNKVIVSIESDITSINEYSDLYRSFINCVRNWPILQPLWDHLLDNEYVTRSPRKIVSILDIFKIDLELAIDASNVEKDISNLLELIESAEKIGDANLNELRIKLKAHSQHIDLLTSELLKIQKSLKEHNEYRKQLIESTDLSNKISLLITNVEKTNTDMIEMIRRETITHCIRQLQHSLALKETTLSSIILQREIIKDLQKQIDKLIIENESVDLLVKQLSPTTGIIAEGLLGFIKSFTSQMNSLIKKIWAYPLQIQACSAAGSDSGDLDYKFPLIVGTKHNVVPDIKLGSSGMREIIDLAFKVTAMKYLGLSESPLYLDEWGGGFDEVHKNSAIVTIKSLLEINPITQLFLVSHNYSQYGALVNSEACVLDATNITVPHVYNKHVIIN